MFETPNDDSQRRLIIGAGKRRISPGQKATLRLLKTAAAAALNNNHVVLPVNPDQPTITANASVAGALGGYNWSNAGGTQLKFRKSLGKEYNIGIGRILATQEYTAGFPGNLSAGGLLSATCPGGGIGATPGSNPSGPSQTTCSSLTFQTPADANRISMQLRGPITNTPYRVIVDGQRLSDAGITFGNSGNIWVDFLWGTTKSRIIEVQSQVGASNISDVDYYTATGGGLLDLSFPYQVNDICFGDSFGEAFNMGTLTNFFEYDGVLQTFAARSAKHSVFTNGAIGGSGYWNTLGGSRPTMRNAQDYLLTSPKLFDFHRVILAGGFNDKNQIPDATTRAMARAAWANVRVKQPNALIVVFGVFGGNTVLADNSPTCVLEAGLKAEFQSWNDPLSMFIDVSPNRAQAWTFGDGDEATAPTNLPSNCNLYICNDHTHPNRAGHLYMGGLADAQYRNKLAQMAVKYHV